MKKKKRGETTDRDVWGDVEGEKKKMEEAKKEKEQKDAAGAEEESEDEESDESDEEGEESGEEEEESEDDDDDGGGKGSDISDDEGTERKAQEKKKEKTAKEKKSDSGAAAHAHSAAPQQTIDLFGLSGGGSAEEQFPPQGADLVATLYGKESGVLYESKLLQVGAKLTVENNNSCKFVFFYGNRGSNSLKDVTVEAPASEGDAFQIKVRPEEPLEVAPRKQIQHLFLFHCFKPFKGPLAFLLKFNYQGSPYTIRLLLPLTIANFTVPATLSAEQFTGAWTKFTNEVIGVRKSDAPVALAALQTAVAEKLHMAVIPGVDKNAENFVAAGTFHTATKTPAGTFVTMAAMLRVETKSGMPVVRLTVHSGHQMVSEALMNAATNALQLRE
jgi:hypothetical protein